MSSATTERDHPPGDRHRHRPGRPRGAAAEMAPLTYDYLVLALGATVNFFGVKGAAEHAFPLYTLADAVRLQRAHPQKWEAADNDPALSPPARSTSSSSAVVHGRRERGRDDRALSARPYRGLPPSCRRPRAAHPRGVRARACWVCSRRTSRPTPSGRWRSAAWSRGSATASSRRSPDARHADVGPVLQAHTLVWGAGLQANPLVHVPGPPAAGGRPPSAPTSAFTGHPEVFVVGDVAGSRQKARRRPCPSSARSHSSPARARARISRAARGQHPAPFTLRRQGHDGDHRTRRGRVAAAARPHDERHAGLPRLGRRAPRPALRSGEPAPRRW